MSKATPGPWKVLPAEIGVPYLRIRGTRLGARFKVANVLAAEYFPQDAIETDANARLIAAAPEMLELLKAVSAALYIDDYGHWSLESTFNADGIDQVIAKALGSAA